MGRVRFRGRDWVGPHFGTGMLIQDHALLCKIKVTYQKHRSVFVLHGEKRKKSI